MNQLDASANSETSSSLLHRARGRDPEAWQRLSELYGPVVYGWVRAAGVREHDAADIVQDVFQAVFTSLGRFRQDRPTDRFRDWLWTITRRRAIDLARTRQSAGRRGGERRRPC
jgi:RNA polymerase sigma-70 factor (ECF subfamily)